MNEEIRLLLPIIVVASLFAIAIIILGRIKNKKEKSTMTDTSIAEDPIAQMSIMPEIKFNPFRFLGLFANATKKERAAQLAQANAYLRVGQELDNPLRLQHLLGTFSEDEESIREAESQLTLDDERAHYSAFWFVHGPNPDEDLKAINLLNLGRTSQALAIWSHRDDPEALQNQLVTFLILGKWKQALMVAQRLYREESEIRRLVYAISEDFSLKMKTIADAVADNPLWTSVLNELLPDAYRKQIIDAIVNNDSSLLEAADDLIRLREILGSNDVECQALADKLAKALAKQYIYSSNKQYVAKCLSKAYDIVVDEETKALITQRMVAIAEEDDSGRCETRMDIPEVRKAKVEQLWIWLGVIVFCLLLVFIVGQCSQCSSSKEKKRLPEQSVPEVQAPKFEDLPRPYVTQDVYPSIYGDSVVWKKLDKPFRIPKKTEEEFRESMKETYELLKDIHGEKSPERMEQEIQMVLDAYVKKGWILTKEEVDSIKLANDFIDE